MAGPVPAAVGVLTGVAVGGAATVALDPAFEIPRQDAWSRNANRILDVNLLARLVAQGGVDLSQAVGEAARDGFAQDKLDALIYLAQTVPGISEAYDLWRRGLISDGLFSHVLVKSGLDQRYAGPLMQLKTAELVGLGDIAYGIVRGILPAPSYVPVPPPTGGTSVPRFPPLNIDPEELAAKLGYDPEMLHLMVGRSGLSLAPGLASQALFRGLINENDYLLAIAEGDLRTEWATTLRDASRQILTSGEYAELELRGFVDAPTRRNLTARHGMSDADSDRLYNVLGRAPAIKQVYIGLARGGTYDGQPKTIPEPFLSAVQRANIRPEWYDIEYALRYSLPSAFVVRALLKDGAIDAARAQTIFEHEGWPPDLAQLVAEHYAPSATATSDPHVGKAQTQLWNTTHKSYVANEISDATATAALEAAGVGAATVPAVLALWKAERDLIRKSLTSTQVRKAVGNGVTNPATGQPWTMAEGIARLLELGYDQADAETFMAE